MDKADSAFLQVGLAEAAAEARSHAHTVCVVHIGGRSCLEWVVPRSCVTRLSWVVHPEQLLLRRVGCCLACIRAVVRCCCSQQTHARMSAQLSAQRPGVAHVLVLWRAACQYCLAVV